MNKIEAAEKRYANLKYLWQQAELEVAALKVHNAALVEALKELLESTNDVLDATSLVDPAERMFRVTASVVNARQALVQVAGKENND